ncbi:MAG: DNA cytosine methyltransferase [Parcubacteria group bacterium]
MKPRLLDLFCGAGGAAVGYSRAGFEVVGVDIKPQPHYPFIFLAGDALETLRLLTGGASIGFGTPLHLTDFGAIHASPPCQAFTAYRRKGHGVGDGYPDLIAATRTLLRQTGLPYVIENVKGAPLEDAAMLCGSMFDPPLDVQRHRYFEWSGFDWLGAPLFCRHKLWAPRFPAATNRKENSRRTVEVGVRRIPLEIQQRAMGVDWNVTLEELSQMVPPRYTELIGHQLLQHIRRGTA